MDYTSMRQAVFHTLGCKVNQYETQAMMKLMASSGYETGEYLPGDPDIGDGIIVINSCTVTGESDRKLRQLLRRCRRENPRAVLVLTGCMPQAFPTVAESFVEADVILGNAARSSLPGQIHKFLTLGQRIVDIPEHGKTFESLPIDEFQGRTRAFIKIEDGCNRFCSYCIIPYARGRVRSKPLEELAAETRSLAEKGYREVVLVGINLNAYGQEWGGNLCEAVETVAAVDTIDRVRLGSLEPDAMTADVIRRLACQPKLCPQFHLALQSGCDETLRRMNRHYSTEEFETACRELHRFFPGCALTTDIMVGFPGEDEKEFARSLSFVEKIGFAKVHVFSYSPRPGTPAAKAPHQVTGVEKARRSRQMIAVCEKQRDAYLASQIGTKTDVLLETRRQDDYIEGYTPHYIPVKVKLDGHTEYTPGQLVSVRLISAEDGTCIGSIES